MSTPERTEYRIEGMSCGHCASSVRGEVEQIDGVDSTEIDLGSGRLTVTGAGVDPDDVRRAVDRAGYKALS